MDEKLSAAAKSLWAKSPNRFKGNIYPEGSWLPLYLHLADSMEIAAILWDHWVPEGTKKIISNSFENARKLFLFLAAVHDIGKATPSFQVKVDELWWRVEQCGLKRYDLSASEKAPHDLAGHAILRRLLIKSDFGFDKATADTLSVVAGGHHGFSPSSALLKELNDSWKTHTGLDDTKWRSVQQEIFEYAVQISGIDLAKYKNGISITAQLILTGLVIMADWLASNDGYFQYMSLEFPRMETSQELAEAAWDTLKIPVCWKANALQPDAQVADLFHARFELPTNAIPRPVQQAVFTAMRNIESPGILVIEAPMGEGKTEAALMAAEIMAAKTGRGGVFFALPTQATTDGIFPRINGWIERLNDKTHSLYLAHGKARFNDDFQALAKIRGQMNIWDEQESDETKSSFRNEASGSVVAHDWLMGRKKGILSDFVVGTIDQILMAALKQRHLALRHLGLANKVVIIDECHSYDAYMSQYLGQTLEWLGAYGVPVIILSATLPSQKRKDVIDAYRNIDSAPSIRAIPWIGQEEQKALEPEWVATRSYPLIVWSDGVDVNYDDGVGSSGRDLCVAVGQVADVDIGSVIEEKLSDGGCACVLCNTVKRAQQFARIFEDRFGENIVELFHSQFLSVDRIKKEKELRKKLGAFGERPSKYIVVGTQVLEQSLDVDFDFMITDIAPVDLLLQRIGRLHRHERKGRPAKLASAQCLIAGAEVVGDRPIFEDGSKAIYGEYLLERTFARLQSVSKISLPRDIPDFVQDVYKENALVVPDSWREDYLKAQAEYAKSIDEKEEKAKTFRIRKTDESDSLIDWLNTRVGDTEKKGEASVRDTSDSLEVIVVQRNKEGRIFLLPWVGEEKKMGGIEIPTDLIPEEKLAGIIASCTINLPGILCTSWLIDRVITELEEDARYYIESWQDSYWLKGALVLMLDECFEKSLCGYNLKYDRKYGLSAEKEKKNG